MIEVYKILNGKEHIDGGQFFKLAEKRYCLRGHDMKLTKKGRDWISGSILTVKEQSTNGTACQPVLSMQRLNSSKNAYDRNYRNDMDVRSR